MISPFGLARRVGRSVAFHLIVLIVPAAALIFGVLGYRNIALHRRDLEAAALASAERVSDAIQRSASYHMLRNDRAALDHLIRTMGQEPGIVGIRIYNRHGQVRFSSEPSQLGRQADTRSEACSACHNRSEPLARLERRDRFRIYRSGEAARILGVINPIENQAVCSGAPCHAHPPDQKILGVLDTSLSLETADRSLADGARQIGAQTAAAVAAVSLLCGVFVWRVVHRPLRVLEDGTRRLARGELGLELPARARNELGELARSFNLMSRALRAARDEAASWARTLETRVEQKSRELERAHEHMLEAEKLASTGRLAAIVAHEINNPLSGILTYVKLLRKWLERGEWNGARRDEIRSSLELVENESRRCGDIVRNLLVFARAAPLELAWTRVDAVIGRAVRLVAHELEIGGVELELDVAPDLPEVRCDPAQIEQVVLALVMNAIEAMPAGGRLRIAARSLPDARGVGLRVEDDGVGIAPEALPHIFEPFFTTKEGRRGTGLGLAVSYTIIRRHGGRLAVESAPDRGSVFRVELPLEADAAREDEASTEGAVSHV